jgi:acyl dehydratase
MTCEAMVDARLDGDVGRVRSYGARFAGVVFPGETLRANIWKRRRQAVGRHHCTEPRQRDRAVEGGVGAGVAAGPGRSVRPLAL